MSDISERLTQCLDSLNINANSFAKSLRYPRSQTVYDIINGKVFPSFDFFKRLLDSEYSEKIDIRWLISGRTFNDVKGESLQLKIPPGPCQQCEIRERLIRSQLKTIESLEARIELQDEQKRKVV